MNNRFEDTETERRQPEYNKHPEIRDEVYDFALAMEEKLRKNDHKRHWSTMSKSDLWEKLKEERNELDDELYNEVFHGKESSSRIQDETVDEGKMAMMIYDNARRES